LLISCVIKDKEEEEEEGDDYKDMGEEDEPMKDDDRQSDPLFPDPLFPAIRSSIPIGRSETCTLME
jgi:hypothetical protein